MERKQNNNYNIVYRNKPNKPKTVSELFGIKKEEPKAEKIEKVEKVEKAEQGENNQKMQKEAETKNTVIEQKTENRERNNRKDNRPENNRFDRNDRNERNNNYNNRNNGNRQNNFNNSGRQQNNYNNENRNNFGRNNNNNNYKNYNSSNNNGNNNFRKNNNRNNYENNGNVNGNGGNRFNNRRPLDEKGIEKNIKNIMSVETAEKEIVREYNKNIDKQKNNNKFDENKRKKVIKEIVNIMKSFHSIKGESYDWSHYIKQKLEQNFNKCYHLKLFSENEKDMAELILKNIGDYLKSSDFRLVHADIHFDNIIYCNDGKMKIIDFERSLYAPIDYELDIFLRMCNSPLKYASIEAECFVKNEDYQNIEKYFKEFYPEIYDVNNFGIRHEIYNLEANLRLLPRFPEDNELKKTVVEIMILLNKIMKLNQ
mgnify:CR=1 FL=1